MMTTVEQVASLPIYYRREIPVEYLDMMGHMNICWYMTLFLDGAWGFFDNFGISRDYIEGEKRGLFAATHHIQYFAEVYSGEIVAIGTRLLDYSAKRLHFMQFMLNESRQNIAASIEVLAVHVDLVSRRAALLPEHVLQRLEAVKAEHDGFGWEPVLSGVIQA